MTNKVSKLLLGSVMTLSGVAGAVGTSSLLSNNATIIHAGEEGDVYDYCQGFIGTTQATMYASVRHLTYDNQPSLEQVKNDIRAKLTIKSGKVTSADVEDVSSWTCSYTFGSTTTIDSSNATVTSSNWKDNTPGSYSFTASYPGTSSIYFTVKVADSFSPVISGQLNYSTNADNPISLEEIKSNLRAVDETDGSVEITIIEDNYSSNKNQKGSYTIVFRATDKSGNSSDCFVTVIVLDESAPVISGSSKVTRRLSSDLTVEEIKSSLNVTDNLDSSVPLVVELDNYTSNKDIPGTYQVIFSATDSSGNKSTHTVEVIVVDDVKPVITGSNSYTKHNNVTVSRDYYLSQLEVSDNVDTLELSQLNIVSDTFTGNADKVGTYQIVVNITDNAGNTSDNFTITITVDDKIPPVFWANGEFYVIVEPTTVLSTENIAYIARALGIVDSTKTARVELLSNSYYGNEATTGEYDVVVKATYEDGSTSIGTITLAVSDELGDTVIIPADKVEKKKSRWDKIKAGAKKFFSFKWLVNGIKFIWDCIKTVGSWIVGLFTGLWDGIKWFWNKLF